ncbi:MAG: hypothetical protein ACXADB_10515 [Candidatus Hermodarchaeia archaeon]|jgi:hypothetical protein
MGNGRIVYEMPKDLFRKNQSQKIVISAVFIGLYIVIISLFILTVLEGEFHLLFFLILFGGLTSLIIIVFYMSTSDVLRQKRLVIYEDGIIPLKGPITQIMNRDPKVPVEDIQSIRYYHLELDDDMFEFYLEDNEGITYSVEFDDLHEILEDIEKVKVIKGHLIDFMNSLKGTIPVEEDVMYSPFFLYGYPTNPESLEWKGRFWNYERLRLNMTPDNISDELLEAWRNEMYPDDDVPEVQGLLRALEDSCKMTHLGLQLEPGWRELKRKDVAISHFEPWLIHLPFKTVKMQLVLAPGEIQWIVTGGKKESNSDQLDLLMDSLLGNTKKWLENGNRFPG